MALFPFRKTAPATPAGQAGQMEAFLQGFSIEVMPRTAEKVEDFRAILPSGTRVYIAHIEGTPIEEMVATARRIGDERLAAMPHFPARIIKDKATLADWVARSKDAGVRQGLLLAGGVAQPMGEFATSMELLESGAFAGFDRLHVAGHPEGNKDIDADGSYKLELEAALLKSACAERTDELQADGRGQQAEQLGNRFENGVCVVRSGVVHGRRNRRRGSTFFCHCTDLHRRGLTGRA